MRRRNPISLKVDVKGRCLSLPGERIDIIPAGTVVMPIYNCDKRLHHIIFRVTMGPPELEDREYVVPAQEFEAASGESAYKSRPASRKRIKTVEALHCHDMDRNPPPALVE